MKLLAIVKTERRGRKDITFAADLWTQVWWTPARLCEDMVGAAQNGATQFQLAIGSG